MLNSEKKFRAVRDKKKILTLVSSEKKFLNETKKPYPPPCKLNGRSLCIDFYLLMFAIYLLVCCQILQLRQELKN